MDMRSTIRNTLAVAALALAIAAPVAYAAPADMRTPAVPQETVSDVPPPPSSIAASAADEYEVLRASGGQDPVPQPVASEPSAPGAFDWVSAAIGAAAASALTLLSIGALSLRRPTGGSAARA
jgi:hypothetical protein